MAQRPKTAVPGPELPVRFFQPPAGAPCAIMTADAFAELFRLAQRAVLEAPAAKPREDPPSRLGSAALRTFLLDEDAVRDVDAYLTGLAGTFEFGSVFAPEDEAEDAAEVVAYDAAKARNEETFPLEVARRLAAGDNPLKVFREYRGLTQEKLAKKAELSTGYLSQLETGHRPGAVPTLRRLANILRVEAGDLVG